MKSREGLSKDRVNMVQTVLARKDALTKLDTCDFLREILALLGDRVTHANSLGAEDAVICDMLARVAPMHKSFTLDTGRLPYESYELMARQRERYGIVCEVAFPERDDVETMVNGKGVNLFYESVENRRHCCEIRKVHPLNRVLAKYDGWICGLRREQSVTRARVEKIETDPAHGGRLKFNPLADWTREQVWEYIRKNSVPYNRLHDQGYASIGCAPCTRAILDGEPERAGRWWWENPDTKECGLHR